MLRHVRNANTATAIALAFGLASGAAILSPANAADQTSGSAQTAPTHSTGADQRAGDAPSQQKATPGSNHYTATELRGRADELIGKDVVNRNGNQVGDLENIVVDRQTNQPYAVVEVGGVLGIGAKNVVIPFDQLQVGEDKITLMSQKSEDDLKTMPAYDKNRYSPLRQAEGSAGTPVKPVK